MLVGRVEPRGQDRPGWRGARRRATPGVGHGRPAGRVVDHAGGGADHVRARRGERVEQVRGLARVHRVDALAVAQLADGRARSPPRCRRRSRATPSRAAPRGARPTVVLPAPIRPGDHDVRRRLLIAHRVAAYTRAMGPPPPIAPPAVIGILGGGQLGRMLGGAARAMGYRVAVLDPDPDCPAAAVADRVVVGVVRRRRGGAAAGRAAAPSSRTSWSTSPPRSSRPLEAVVPVRPGPRAAAGHPGPAGRAAVRRGAGHRGRAVARGPVRGGRPRRGRRARPAAPAQAADRRLRRARPAPDRDAGRARRRLGAARPAGRRRRCSPSASSTSRPSCRSSSRARLDGAAATFPIARNVHDAGILVESVAPAPIARRRRRLRPARSARTLAAAMDLCGTLTVELFLLPRRLAGRQRAGAARPQLAATGRSRAPRPRSSSSTSARSAGSGSARPAALGAGRDGQPPGRGPRRAGPAARASPRRSPTRPSTSTCTTSARSSNAARWAT